MTAMQTVDPSLSRTPIALDATNLPTVCVLCSHNCGIRVDVRDGRIVEVRADETNPITTGYICNKGFSIPLTVTHAQRVQHPLKRRPDGSFERVSWQVAIAEIAAKLNAIRQQHSPRAIGLVGLGGQANFMGAFYGLGFFRLLGGRKWFNAFAQEKTQHWLVDQWMFDAPPVSFLYPDEARARFLLVLGTNPRISNRGHNATETFKAINADRERILVVVDPRETETTRGATCHLRVRPGTDVYLLLGMAATIVREGLTNMAFVRERTIGFEVLREALAAVDVEEMARRCGIETAALVETARGFARAESAAILTDLGVEMAPFLTLMSYLVRVLLVLTGNLARPGGNVFLEGAVPAPQREAEPERALVSGIAAINALVGCGMFSPNLAPEEILVEHPERIRALIVEAANPLLSYADTRRWREARERLELLVVIEPAMTETARLADYVLPVPAGYEKWEFCLFPNGYPAIHMQVRPPVVPSRTEALPEAEIYARLAEAMGLIAEPPQRLRELAASALTSEGAGRFLAATVGFAAEEPQSSGERFFAWAARTLFPRLPGRLLGSPWAVRAREALLRPVATVTPQLGRTLFSAYRALGPHLPAPPLTAVWFVAYLNALLRPDAVLRTLSEEWRGRNPFELGAELFRRVLAHPEGVEIARLSGETNYDDHVGFADKRVRLAPEPMIEEMRRAIDNPPTHDPDYPFVLAAGLRTRWTANTIQRDPAWRKGRGPHCALNLSPGDAQRIGLNGSNLIRVVTRRGALVLPAQIDPKLMDGHVWMPNGFGMVVPANGNGSLEVVGANQNELTDANDRDPFTGTPHHRYVPCRLEAVENRQSLSRREDHC